VSLMTLPLGTFSSGMVNRVLHFSQETSMVHSPHMLCFLPYS
jgi:hypothetical protein